MICEVCGEGRVARQTQKEGRRLSRDPTAHVIDRDTIDRRLRTHHWVDKPAEVGVDVQNPFGDGQHPFLQAYSSFPLDARDHVLEFLPDVDAQVYCCG